MPTDRYNDLAAFRAFLDAKLADPANDLTLDEVLALWAAENPSDDERTATRRVIGEGLPAAMDRRKAGSQTEG